MIQIERWNQFYPDCLPLFEQHAAEIGEGHYPLEPDTSACEFMDRTCVLLIVTAREEGKIIGYATFTIGPNLMSRNVKCATQGPVFVGKEHRKSGLGIKLFEFAIEAMRERGVKDIYLHHWLKGESARLKVYFERKGAIELEHVYSLRI